MDYPSDHNLTAALSDLVNRMQDEAENIRILEQELKEAKQRHKNLKEFEIPQLMDNLEGKITLPDGRVVTVRSKIRANVSSANKPLAYEWLKENGYGDVVKNTIIFEFGKGDSEKARQLINIASKSEWAKFMEHKEAVHPQTLERVVRDSLEEGQDIPEEVFGIYNHFETSVK